MIIQIIMKKIFIFLIFIVLFFIFQSSIKDLKNNKIFEITKNIIPENVKTLLLNSIFIVYKKNKEIENLTEILIYERTEAQLAKINFLEEIESFNINKKEINDISSETNNYKLNIYTFPFPSLPKPSSFIEKTKNEIIIATGYGKFYYFNKNQINSNKIKILHINSNIKDLILDSSFYEPSRKKGALPSIQDIFLFNNKLYVSFNNEVKENCYNTSIIVANFNLDYLKFIFFSPYDECHPYPVNTEKNSEILFDHQHSGGRMRYFKNNKIIFTTGDYGSYKYSQNINSLFGKILSIDLKTEKKNIISSGHRNPKGLYYDDVNDVIINTEHGPCSGDEINVNLSTDNVEIENFGWPISSYGHHCDNIEKAEAPFHKSHEKYGFIEPIKFWQDAFSMPPSEIIKIPKTFDKKFNNDYFMITLGYGNQIKYGQQSIHHYRFSNDYKEIVFEDIIQIKRRMRDILYEVNSEVFIITLDTIQSYQKPGIAFLTSSK